MLKLAKVLGIVALGYVLLVVGFESLIGYFQPSGETTLVIYTEDPAGDVAQRVVARLDTEGQLYVAANHWPRGWYRRALANPSVRALVDGEMRDFLAVPIRDDEHDRVESAHRLGFIFRILTGFPPRYFLRLDPR